MVAARCIVWKWQLQVAYMVLMVVCWKDQAGVVSQVVPIDGLSLDVPLVTCGSLGSHDLSVGTTQVWMHYRAHSRKDPTK